MPHPSYKSYTYMYLTLNSRADAQMKGERVKLGKLKTKPVNLWRMS